VLVLFSFLGPDVWRRTATYNVAEMLAPPGAGYPLGADALGRDNLWELMLGGRLPILTGFGALFMRAYGQVLNLVMVIGIITVGLNLLADLLSSASDPRIGFG